jgi:large subunit ribosomal protein L13
MKTYIAKKEDIKRKWYIVDAEGKVLGRMATRIAAVLRGKHKPMFTPSVDTGDFVVVINAEKLIVTGRKKETKVYQSHSGYPGGFKEVKFTAMQEKFPERVLELAVKGMLPKGRLGKTMYTKLRIYKGPTHPYAAQKPVELIK